MGIRDGRILTSSYFSWPAIHNNNQEALPQMRWGEDEHPRLTSYLHMSAVVHAWTCKCIHIQTCIHILKIIMLPGNYLYFLINVFENQAALHGENLKSTWENALSLQPLRETMWPTHSSLFVILLIKILLMSSFIAYILSNVYLISM